MSKVTQYIFHQLFIAMIFITVGLTCVIWLIQSLRFVDLIVNRGLTAGMFVYLTGLMLPFFLTVILPIALFVSVVFTYSKMVTDRELVAMRAAGIGQGSLAKPALALAFLVMLMGYALNLFFLPESYRMFRDLQHEFRNAYSHILLQEGAFNSVDFDFTIYVRERTKDGQLLGILVHDGRDPQKPWTLMAARGAMMESETGEPRVVVFNGNRQELDTETHNMTIIYFDRYTVNLPKSVKDGERYREVEERSVQELLNPEEGVNPNDYGKFITEGHRRIMSPLFAFGFTLIGLACILSGNFTRRSQPNRIIVAVILLIVSQGIDLGFRNLCAKNNDLIPLMYLNAFVPIVLGAYYTLRMARPGSKHKHSGDFAPQEG